MRFMLIVRATEDTEAGKMPERELVDEMGAFHEAMAAAGVNIIDASGLQPSAKGFRIRHAGGEATIIDGPFAETKELIAGYTVIEVKSREEAIAWAKQMPNPAGRGKIGEIEVRPLFSEEDFEVAMRAAEAERAAAK